MDTTAAPAITPMLIRAGSGSIYSGGPFHPRIYCSLYYILHLSDSIATYDIFTAEELGEVGDSLEVARLIVWMAWACDYVDMRIVMLVDVERLLLRVLACACP